MSEAWLFRIEFGAILIALTCLLGPILRRRRRAGSMQRDWKAISVEGAVLLAVTAVTAGRYVWLLLDGAAAKSLPAIGWAWVIVFGAASTIYLGTKAARVKLVRN